MTDREQIEQLKEANETWRKQWANSRYEVEQLKAQVNCLRVALMRAITFREDSPNYGNPEQVLEATPEQCLAEVKAKAIEDALFYADHIGSNGNGYDYAEEDLQAYADQLRGSKRNEQNP